MLEIIFYEYYILSSCKGNGNCKLYIKMGIRWSDRIVPHINVQLWCVIQVVIFDTTLSLLNLLLVCDCVLMLLDLWMLMLLDLWMIIKWTNQFISLSLLVFYKETSPVHQGFVGDCNRLWQCETNEVFNQSLHDKIFIP